VIDRIPFLAHSEEERNTMINELGITSINELFNDIPKDFLLNKPLNLPEPLNEWQLQKHIDQKIKSNTTCLELNSFLGGGVYNHYVPAVVDAIASRGEFLTAYTPYQPEMSQGLLQALNNFSNKISEITSLPTVTCSHYDGATALAEATWMAVSKTDIKSILVANSLFPHYREVLETYCFARNVKITEVPVNNKNGYLDLNAIENLNSDDFAALVIQTPNSYGVIEEFEKLSNFKKKNNLLTICSMHPYMPFAKDFDKDLFDIITFEGQSLGINMFAGGAHLGILACKKELRNLTPGRLIGKVSDIYGNPSLALVFEDREQHVARDRATSNICSNQALNALRAGVFIDLLGSEGIFDLYCKANIKAKALMKALTAIRGLNASYDGEIFNEFIIRFEIKEDLSKCVIELQKKNILAGITSDIFNNLNENEILISVTEITSQKDLEDLIVGICYSLKLDSEISINILRSFLELNPINNLENVYKNNNHLKPSPEHRIIRKYTGWSRNNFGVDTGSYPLGSCTMKYNPKRNDYLTEQLGFQKLHPFQPKNTIKGLTDIYNEMENYISEILGMDSVDLSPAAGAHGELKGLLIARRYFEDIGENYRNEVIIPDSAHGTNPATANMVGYVCKIIPTRSDGLMDSEALKRSLSKNTAVVMTTNPSTFGVFERDIKQIVQETHKNGALMYYDGANMNALMGITNPGIMGFDIAHLNVHKTLSTPHGGGGPGAGPVGVKDFLSKYINKGFQKTNNNFNTKIKLYGGHISVLLRAYCYIRSMGYLGLKKASEDAVLNANYLKNKLSKTLPAVFNRTCMHEALLDGSSLPIKILDLAKRMIDFNVHPPTLVGAGCVYFGKELSNAMLFEPTESETKEELDKLINIIENIVKESYEDSSIAAKAPIKGEISRILIN